MSLQENIAKKISRTYTETINIITHIKKSYTFLKKTTRKESFNKNAVQQ